MRSRLSSAKSWRSAIDWISQQLGDKEYLTGPTFTVADAYLFTVDELGKVDRHRYGSMAGAAKLT